jgi:hypothetical protein
MPILGALLLLALVALGFAIWLRTQSTPPPPPETTSPKGPTKPGWRLLFQGPAEEWTWLAKPKPGSWHLDVEQQVLWVATQSQVLLKLGDIPDQNWTFRIQIDQLEWGNRVAIFLGYHQQTVNKITHFQSQMISLVRTGAPGEEKKYYLKRELAYHALDPSKEPTFTPLALKRIDVPGPGENTLELSVGKTGIFRIKWNNQEVPELVLAKTNAAFAGEFYKGPFGIYVFQNTVTFQNAQLKLDDSP